MHSCEDCLWDTHTQALTDRINGACIEIGLPLHIITLEDAENLIFYSKRQKTHSLQYLQLVKITAQMYKKWCNANSDALQYVYNSLDCVDQNVDYQDWCLLAFKLRIHV
jgi:hypothetical protein